MLKTVFPSLCWRVPPSVKQELGLWLQRSVSLKLYRMSLFFKLWTLMAGQTRPGFCQNGNNWCLSKGKQGKLFHLLKKLWISQKSEIQDKLTPDWGFGGGNHFIAPNLVIFPAFLWRSANSGNASMHPGKKHKSSLL